MIIDALAKFALEWQPLTHMCQYPHMSSQYNKNKFSSDFSTSSHIQIIS